MTERTEPTERQLRILERVRARIAGRWNASAVVRVVEWGHWEDEELGFPPMGTHASFHVAVPPLDVRVATPCSWESHPTHAIKAMFSYYEGEHTGKPWALYEDRATRRALAALGFERSSSWEATWRLRCRTAGSIVKSITATIEKLGELPLRSLRPADLPVNTRWPCAAVVAILAADDVRIVGPDPFQPGHWRVTYDIDGARIHSVVSDDVMRLIRR